MNFEILKKSNLKKNIIIGVIVVAVIAALVLNFTRAKYKRTESIPLINGTVNYDLADLNAVAVYLQDDSASDGYVKADTIPTSGYAFNEEMSYCTIDGNKDDSITLSYDMNTQTLNVAPLTTKGTKCYLYFDEQASIKDTLLTYYPTVRTRTDFSTTVTETTTGTIYKSVDSSQYDDDGEVYYFAGNPTDNWVSFAGFYWRIIRINGDGSIRLIYSGNGAPATEGDDTQIRTSTFSKDSSTYNNNAYVGYMYTLNEVHGTEEDSGIKGVLDGWYKTNIQDAGYSSYIDTNVGFCNDRTPYIGTGTRTTYTEYGPYNRLYNNGTPTFECENDNDLFTVSSSNKGNKALTYPVGLITMDEVWYAGGYESNNRSYYLYTNSEYWTISPSDFNNGFAWGFRVGSPGDLSNGSDVGSGLGVRPVINLRADVTISSGNGTQSTPFVIATT